jgi:hypothetical protein
VFFVRPLLRCSALCAALLSVSAFNFNMHFCWWACTEQTGLQIDYTKQRDDCRDFAQTRLDSGIDKINPEDEKAQKAKLIALFSDCMGKHGWTVPDGRTTGERASQQASAAPVAAAAAPVAAAQPQQPAQPAPAPAPVQQQAQPAEKKDNTPSIATPVAAAAGAAVGAAAGAVAASADTAQAVPVTPVQASPVPSENAKPKEQPAQEDPTKTERFKECNFARYGASTSSNAAAKAEACDLECAEKLAALPSGPRPSACPLDVINDSPAIAPSTENMQ